MRVRRYLRLAQDPTAEIRTATFEGLPHLVVPVIAMVGNSVIHPMNSEGPEFVPAEELAVAPGGWNGRPVLPDHPAAGQATANEPRTLELASFGRIFDARYEDEKLKVDAWLDVDKAESMGGDAARVVQRVQAGEMIEVSVGAWITAKEIEGTSPAGDRYQVVWSNIVPDHLAMLPEGVRGACSVEHGCGAPRAAQEPATPETPETKKETPMLSRLVASALAVLRGGDPESDATENTRAYVREIIRTAQDSMSDSELRDKLWAALRAIEPGFEWIVDVFPEESLVVYEVWPEGELLTYRRSFSLDGEDVSVNDDREQVEPVTEYKPVTAEGQPEPEQCTCQKRAADGESASPTDDKKKETPIMNDTIKGLVARITGSERSPFSDEDAEHLAKWSEERLTALAEGFEAEPEQPAPEPVAEPQPDPDDDPPAEPPSDTVQLQREEYQALRAAARIIEAQEKERKSALVAILSQAQESFTSEELEAKEIAELEKLAGALHVKRPDFSGKGLPVTASGTNEPPKGYTLAEQRARGESDSAPTN